MGEKNTIKKKKSKSNLKKDIFRLIYGHSSSNPPFRRWLNFEKTSIHERMQFLELKGCNFKGSHTIYSNPTL